MRVRYTLVIYPSLSEVSRMVTFTMFFYDAYDVEFIHVGFIEDDGVRHGNAEFSTERGAFVPIDSAKFWACQSYQCP